MKISWGVGITITIIVFTLITLSFVYLSFGEDVNLVRDDYYEAEVQYEQTKNIVKRTNELKTNLSIAVANNNIELLFPNEFKGKQITGNIYLYRPSDGNRDLELQIEIDSNNYQIINSAKLIPGMWKIKVNWKVDSTDYQTEEILMLQ